MSRKRQHAQDPEATESGDGAEAAVRGEGEAVDADSDGTYFVSIEDFEWRSAKTPEPRDQSDPD